MAIASCSVTIISRGKGRSAVAAAAYRAGQDLQNAYDGLSHNYTRKSGIVYSDILTPAGAPDWAHDRQQLWNRVEETERRKDAQLAREVMIALPRELSPQQNIEVARAYARTFVHEGMIADVSVHDSRDGNPHAHLLLTLRPLEGDSFGKKCREWNSTEKLIAWREQYADLTNRYLERFGHAERIDARSYEAQGIDQLPTVHLGPHAHRMEQKGLPTERGDINREIEKDNQKIREIAKELEQLEQERAQEKERSQPVQQPAGFNIIESYRKAKEEVRKTAGELANRLSDKGRELLSQQQKQVENALSHLRQSGQESPSHPAPMEEPGQPSGSGEPSRTLTNDPRSQPEPSGSQEVQRGSAHPYRPPPLRRHREERTLSGQRTDRAVWERHRHPEPEQERPVPSPPGRSREPKFDEPGDRLPHRLEQTAHVKESPTSQGRPLSPGWQGEHGFNELERGQPPGPSQQPEESRDVASHLVRTPSPGQQRTVSRKEEIARLLKEPKERKGQEGLSRDDTYEPEK